MVQADNCAEQGLCPVKLYFPKHLMVGGTCASGISAFKSQQLPAQATGATLGGRYCGGISLRCEEEAMGLHS